jgi:hypothetical protein
MVFWKCGLSDGGQKSLVATQPLILNVFSSQQLRIKSLLALLLQMLAALSSSKVHPHRYTAFLEAARFWLMSNIESIRQARHLHFMLHCFR